MEEQDSQQPKKVDEILEYYQDKLSGRSGPVRELGDIRDTLADIKFAIRRKQVNPDKVFLQNLTDELNLRFSKVIGEAQTIHNNFKNELLKLWFK